ncbi:hypothetical protein [Paludisphaera borealis]|uniref:Uncharacterized protein n=1 Tax=Paludisphaera borealis TaxID=1387353 RepID=A0A1U7CRT0_9BACT|nr:hypothetical protein [Paludisphaera borealis]APW61641.1 hypothetical protein BSF38_03166 [Paludisphaera borealis]
MFLLSEGSVFDFDLNLLSELLEVIDRQLEVVLSGCDDFEEADQLGYFDRVEHAVGLGFVASQAYLTSTYGSLGIKKTAALSVGPRHREGQTIVAIINHAANFWKHRDEWILDNGVERQKTVRNLFEAIGCPVDQGYPLSCMLTKLADPSPASFRPLVSLLAQWRDKLRESGPPL